MHSPLHRHDATSVSSTFFLNVPYGFIIVSLLLFTFTWLTLVLVLFFHICFEVGRPTGEKLHAIFSIPHLINAEHCEVRVSKLHAF